MQILTLYVIDLLIELKYINYDYFYSNGKFTMMTYFKKHVSELGGYKLLVSLFMLQYIFISITKGNGNSIIFKIADLSLGFSIVLVMIYTFWFAPKIDNDDMELTK